MTIDIKYVLVISVLLIYHVLSFSSLLHFPLFLSHPDRSEVAPVHLRPLCPGSVTPHKGQLSRNDCRNNLGPGAKDPRRPGKTNPVSQVTTTWTTDPYWPHPGNMSQSVRPDPVRSSLHQSVTLLIWTRFERRDWTIRIFAFPFFSISHSLSPSLLLPLSPFLSISQSLSPSFLKNGPEK